MQYEYDIVPVAKCRMTRSDRWKQRPCVMKYWAFKARIKELGVFLPEDGCKIIFNIPMPESWSKKKKKLMAGKPHKNKIDVDNLCKGILDAVYQDDQHIWNIHIVKLWAEKGSIIIGEIKRG